MGFDPESFERPLHPEEEGGHNEGHAHAFGICAFAYPILQILTGTKLVNREHGKPETNNVVGSPPPLPTVDLPLARVSRRQISITQADLSGQKDHSSRLAGPDHDRSDLRTVSVVDTFLIISRPQKIGGMESAGTSEGSTKSAAPISDII